MKVFISYKFIVIEILFDKEMIKYLFYFFILCVNFNPFPIGQLFDRHICCHFC